MIETILYPVLAAVAYSVLVFAKKTQKDAPDKFDKNKLIATAIYGAFIGVVAVVAGAEITEEYVMAQSVAYGYVAILIQNGVAATSRWIKKNY